LELSAKELEEDIEDFRDIHARECYFYAHFQNVPNLPLPKVFDWQEIIPSSQLPGYILMEYLGDDGVNLDFADGLNVEQVKNLQKRSENFGF